MNKELSDILGGLVRTGVAAAFGGLVAKGIVTNGQVETISGAAVVGLVAVWSVWQKNRAAKKLAQAQGQR